MSERVPHDHPSVDTVAGELRRAGGTKRLRVHLPVDAVPTGEVVRVVLDGTTRRGRFEDRGDEAVLRGVYDTPDEARDPGDAPDRLREWIGDRSLDAGRTVHVDEVDAGFRYGLRGPGESAVYADRGSPDDDLASIARDLTD